MKIFICELFTAIFSLAGLGFIMYNLIMFLELTNYDVKHLVIAIISIITTSYVVYKLEKIEDRLRMKKRGYTR